MAKTANTTERPHRAHQWVRVNMDPDANLSALLHGSGARTEPLIHLLSTAADPGHRGDRHVDLPIGEVPGVVEDLAQVLARARETGHPAAGALEEMLKQFSGVST